MTWPGVAAEPGSKGDLPGALLLDLDDTILAFDAVADDCWRTLCDRYAPEMPGVTTDSLFAAIARSRRWFWSDAQRHRAGRQDLVSARRQVVARAFDELGLGLESVAVRLADANYQQRDELVTPFTGAVEALAELRRRGIELALITNGDARYQRAKIERFDLARHFACIVIEGEFGVGKPAAAVFLHALQALGRGPQDAWMVGDSLEFDIVPALTLGMRAVWIDRTRKGPPLEFPWRPSRSIATLTELVSG